MITSLTLASSRSVIEYEAHRNMAGYSGTPLAKKPGIKPQCKLFLSHAPKDYLQLVAPLPVGVAITPRLTRDTDIVHLFATERATLCKALPSFLKTLRPDAMIWVSWPKKASNSLLKKPIHGLFQHAKRKVRPINSTRALCFIFQTHKACFPLKGTGKNGGPSVGRTQAVFQQPAKVPTDITEDVIRSVALAPRPGRYKSLRGGWDPVRTKAGYTKGKQKILRRARPRHDRHA